MLSGLLVQISIHAPLAGCDSPALRRRSPHTDFNPRTPCGVRHVLLQPSSGHKHFNPRTPCGVRLIIENSKLIIELFQSTHPLRGATPSAWPRYCSIRFQSTHPLRGATLQQAPVDAVCHYFNPRTPCGVRPQKWVVGLSNNAISIHAPLAGCDSENAQNFLRILR